MKIFSIIMYVVVALVCHIEVDAACIEGAPRTIFSESFSVSQSVLSLTSQCFGKPTYSAADLRVPPPREFEFPPEKKKTPRPVWSSWLTQEFVLPPGTAMDSVYTLTLEHDGNTETIWTIKILNTNILVGVRPVPFYVGNVVQQENTVWVFFWKKPYYYLDIQEKQQGEWKKMASLRLDRPYAYEAHSAILVNGERIGVKLILKDATYEPHSTTFVEGEQFGVKLTLKDGTEEFWRIAGDRFVQQELK